MPPYDLIVIGCGPAGEKGAAQAAYFGKKVAVIERGANVGGACINTGTVPSKTLRETALYFTGMRQRGLYGIDYSLREGLSIRDFMYRKDKVVAAEREKSERNLIAHSIDLVRGTGRFVDSHTIAVETASGKVEQLEGQVILVTTGSRPQRPPSIPFDSQYVLDSDSILEMDRIPKSLSIVGAGVIGCEYASTFTALGVKVVLIDGRDRVLPFLDWEISLLLQEGLRELGLEFRFNERMKKIERIEGGTRLTLNSGEVIEADAALMTAGRGGAIDMLDLAKGGVLHDEKGLIKVNEHYQTSVPHIYAAGDVIGFPALASISMEQARVSVCHAFQFAYKKRVASLLPIGIYTIPEISAVGESEDSCREKGINYEVGRAHYANNARGLIMGDLKGMLKLVFQRETRQLLGVHVIGEVATELIHLGAMVVENGGKLDVFIDSVYNFPTLSELYKYAAYDGLGNLAGHKLREG